MKIKNTKIFLNPAGTEGCETGTETSKKNYHWTITSEEVIRIFEQGYVGARYNNVDGIYLTPYADGLMAEWTDNDDEHLTHKKQFDCNELLNSDSTLEYIADYGKLPWEKIADTLNEYFKDYQDPLPF